MTDKITLDPLSSGYDVKTINSNFKKLEAWFNENSVSRDVESGELNSLLASLDMNLSTFTNIQYPVDDLDVVTLEYAVAEIGAVENDPTVIDDLTQPVVVDTFSEATDYEDTDTNVAITLSNEMSDINEIIVTLSEQMAP
jgi:hypothetical protein